MHLQTETEVLNIFFFLNIFWNLIVLFLETWCTICFLLTKQQLKETVKRKRLTLNSHLEQSSTSAAQKYYESVHPSSLYWLWPLSELLLFSQAAVLSAPWLPQRSKDSIRAVFFLFIFFPPEWGIQQYNKTTWSMDQKKISHLHDRRTAVLLLYSAYPRWAEVQGVNWHL